MIDIISTRYIQGRGTIFETHSEVGIGQRFTYNDVRYSILSVERSDTSVRKCFTARKIFDIINPCECGGVAKFFGEAHMKSLTCTRCGKCFMEVTSSSKQFVDNWNEANK